MSVFIQKSKTDIYRDGNHIIIARTGNNLCPVNNLEYYLEWIGNNHEIDIFKIENVPLSYCRMRQLFYSSF